MAKLLFTHSHIATRGVRKHAIKPKLEFGIVTLTFITVIMTTAVSLLYLTHTNRVATKGYLIKDLETQKFDLMEQNERLRLAVAKERSLTEIRKSATTSAMVAVDKVEFALPNKKIAFK